MVEEAMRDWAETLPETTLQIWARRAAKLAHVPAEQEEGEWLDLVLIRLGRESCHPHRPDCPVCPIRDGCKWASLHA